MRDAKCRFSKEKEIRRLKPKMRLPILLKYVEGLSYAEIAEVLGCSKGTVASRLNRAQKRWREASSICEGDLFRNDDPPLSSGLTGDCDVW